MMSVFDLKIGLESGGLLENGGPAPEITNYSKGYRNNGLAKRITFSGASGTLQQSKNGKIGALKKSNKRNPEEHEGRRGRKRTSSETSPEATISAVQNTTAVNCMQCGAYCSDRFWFVQSTQTQVCDKCKGRKRKGYILHEGTHVVVPTIPQKKKKIRSKTEM